MSAALVFTCLGGTLLAVLLVMALSFLIGRATGKYSIIDAIWGPGFVVTAWVAFAITAGHGDSGFRWLVLALVTIWGLRLGGYILLRNDGLPEDPRYAQMLADSGPGAILAKVQLPQGAVMWFVSLTVQVELMAGPPLPSWGWLPVTLGVAVFLTGLFFESVGDAQLAAFKKNPAHQGQVMDRGLWRYTRHPNYFGDATVWTGLFVLGLWSWVGLLTVLSPLLMTYLIVAKTGKALTEKRMSSAKPGYAEYVQRTSGFFPRPPLKPLPQKRPGLASAGKET